MRTAQTTSWSGTWEASFKDFFDGTMQSLVTNMCPLLDWLKGKGRVRKVTPKGKNIVFATDLRLSHSFGYRGEGDPVPSSGKVENVQGSVPYQKAIRGHIGLTFESMKFGRQGPGAFVTAETQEMKGAAIMMRKLAQIAAWGAGTGELAKLNGALVAQDDVTVESTETYDTCLPGTRWLIEGMKVIGCESHAHADAYEHDANWVNASRIMSISSDTTLDLEEDVTCADDQYLVEHQGVGVGVSADQRKEGSVVLSTDGNNEGEGSFHGPQGMLAMCDDGTFNTSYCGISEAQYPQWKAVIDHNSGGLRALTLDLFYIMYYKLAKKIGSFKVPVTAWMNPDLYRTLVKLLEHFIEFKPRSLEPGFDEFDVMIQGVKVPIKLDFEAPSYVWFLNPQFITWAEGQPLQLAREGGSIWRPDPDRRDQFEAMYRWIWQTYTRNRNKHGLIKDLEVEILSQ